MSKAFDIIIKPTKKTTNTTRTQSSPPKTSVWFFFALLIIVFLVIADFSSRSNNSQETIVPIQPQNNQQNQQILGDNISQDTEKSPKSENTDVVTKGSETPIATTEQKSSETTTPEINKLAIKIKVLNGSGVAGVANNTKKHLEEQGFQVESIGTARNLYNQTIIYYNKDKKDTAVLVQLALEKQNIRLEENSTLTSNYDLLVVIGQNQ